MRFFLTLFMCLLTSLQAAENNAPAHEIAIQISLKCPDSVEYENFVKSIPASGTYSSSYDEWESSFKENMTQLMHLIESRKVSSSYWSVKTDEQILREEH